MTMDPISYLTEERKLDGAQWAEAVSYDPAAGTFTWRIRPEERFQSRRACNIWNAKYSGKPAGTTNGKHGHRRITLGGKSELEHRLAWFLSFGDWPSGEIDHINGDASDNRLCNLRDVPHGENMRNVKLQSNNRSGVQGVYWHKAKGKWSANIGVHGRTKSLGYFDCLSAASAAREAAKSVHGYHENHGRAI